ncbi:MAG: GntR family transcriptional regulator [Tannerella sp.]|jgi:predicted RNA-binding protein (virulence factor B family)|nr:GntR family transcriptional regulator [Tannerella sp.]
MEIGKMNRLKVIKTMNFGVYLDGGEGREILLPTRYVPDGCGEGDEVEVFIYHDNEGRLIATTLRPLATVGEFQWMQVKEVSAAGAFLEWGLMKDLLVPHREQKTPMKKGHRYLVYVYLDFVTKRIVASARIDRFLDNVPPQYEQNREVDLIVAESTEMGYKVIINHQHWGLVYHNEVFHPLEKGEKRKGYIKEVREDDKIDVSLYPLGYDKIDGIARRVLQTLTQNGGFLPLHDKSNAEEIYSLLACSKKSFKKAVGALYRQQLISLEKEGIRSVSSE